MQWPIEVLKTVATGAWWSDVRGRAKLLKAIELKTLNFARLCRRGGRSNIGYPVPIVLRQTSRVADRKCDNVYRQLNVDAHPASPVVL